MNCHVDTSANDNEDLSVAAVLDYEKRLANRIGYDHLAEVGSNLSFALKMWRITDARVAELVERCPETHILRQLNLLPYRSKPENVSGLLIASIEDIKRPWGPPKGMTPEEVAEVDDAITRRMFPFPAPAQFESSAGAATYGEDVTVPFVPGSVEPEVTQEDACCDDPTCPGCVPF